LLYTGIAVMIRDFIDRRLKRSYGCDKPAAVRRVVAGRRGAVESGILPGGRKRAWSEMMPAREQAQPRSIQACKRANTTFIVATMRINSLHLKAAGSSSDGVDVALHSFS
jgi:hypothetical protein